MKFYFSSHFGGRDGEDRILGRSTRKISLRSRGEGRERPRNSTTKTNPPNVVIAAFRIDFRPTGDGRIGPSRNRPAPGTVDPARPDARGAT